VTAVTFPMTRTGSTRWLLLGSLALNLFFIGYGGAMYWRHQPPVDRNISTRIDRLADILPAADAAILRRNYDANRAAVDKARRAYENGRDAVRASLRKEPFDAAAMTTAMTQTRTARQEFEQILQTVIVASAGEMSQAGRNRLADYGPQQGNQR
jgi:uncharacterized membrane protein